MSAEFGVRRHEMADREYLRESLNERRNVTGKGPCRNQLRTGRRRPYCEGTYPNMSLGRYSVISGM